jgi:hypothetical protein
VILIPLLQVWAISWAVTTRPGFVVVVRMKFRALPMGVRISLSDLYASVLDL